jgi:hypothetical protein
LSNYLNGESLLADAVLRVGGLGREYAVLIVEGPTDKAVFASWCCSIDQIVVAGNKGLALNAHRQMTDGDREKIVVIVDCDGDPGALCGSPNLIITAHNDLEADLMMGDRLRNVIPLLVAGGVDREERLVAIRNDVVTRAIGAATGIETVRHAARNAGVGLRGHPRELDFRQLRERGDTHVEPATALEELARVHQEASSKALSDEDLARIRQGLPGRTVALNACSGKVLIAAAAAVLHMDFGVPKRVIPAFDDVVRMAAVADAGVREHLVVVQRVRQWEARHGIRLLAA